MKTVKILVTGGAGFIGSHLVDRLVKNYQVSVIDDLSGGKKRNINPKAKFYCCDLRDAKKTDQIISKIKPQLVYHLAANAAENMAQFSPIDITSRNYNTFINTLVASIKAGLKRFVAISSVAVYGAIQTPFRETYKPEPEDLYGISKLAMEESLKVLAKVHQFEYVIARPHNVYGPRQNMADPYRNVVMIFMNSLLNNQPYYIYGTGEQRRCFSYVDDVIEALIKCGFLDVSGMTFNIGSDSDYSINELSSAIQKITNTKLAPIYLEERPQEVTLAIPNHQLSKKFLQYRDHAKLNAGLKITWEYAKQQGHQQPIFTMVEIDSPKLPRNWKKLSLKKTL